MLSPKTKTNLSRIIPFGVIWFLFGIVYAQLERGILGELNYYPSTGNPYSFSKNLIFTPGFSLITGLLIGTLEVKYFNRLFIKKSFGQKIVLKSLFYLLLICALLLLTTAIANSLELRIGFFTKQVWKNVWSFVAVYAFIGVIVYIAAILIVTQFYDQVSESIGRGVLANFFTGKYHKPVEEERIYMFLDMKSSTTIAEALGHVRYFEMLKEYYSDLSDPIIKHSGEIYQYVGDEIIVSWKLKDGLQNNNCIRCFFTMKRAIKKQSKKYNERFGVVPQFKAGLHIGRVTTGEIGVIKKDIIFTGDVLNATSRIQGLCNTYDVDILISDELRKKLSIESNFQIKSLGANELRGKDEKIELFTILTTK
jgi:adenylate cyclase